jgi:hypothetical protein
LFFNFVIPDLLNLIKFKPPKSRIYKMTTKAAIKDLNCHR